MKSFAEQLVTTSADWVDEGVITEAQRAALLQRHPVAPGGGSRFIGIISTVGGLLFTVGVSLIIKSNWQELGDWLKIGGLIALLVGFYAVGWKLKVIDRSHLKTGEACLMSGQIFFLCGIVLVSQIFHLNSRPATGVLFWWLGIALVPWLARANGAQLVSVIAGLVWFGLELSTPGSWLELPLHAGEISHDIAGIMAVFVLLGLALWLGGLALRATRWPEFAALHETGGIIVAGGALYWLGFVRHFWEWRMWRATPAAGGFAPALAVALLLAAGAGVAAWRARRRETLALLPWLALVLAPVLGVMLLGPLGDNGWLWSALAWLTLFLLSIAIVRVGLDTGREAWVNLGILLIAANIITRYFDLFGTLLEGGVFFVVTGLMVAALGLYLERKRRALVSSLRRERQHD